MFDQLLAAVKAAVANIVQEHGSEPDVVRELQSSFEVLASELTDGPLEEWFRSVGPHLQTDIEAAVHEISVEDEFLGRRRNTSRVVH